MSDPNLGSVNPNLGMSASSQGGVDPFFSVYAPSGLVRFAAGCIQCDSRPLCPRCRRPIQLGAGSACVRGVGPEMYPRGMLWHFSSEPLLAAWEALHPPGHAGAWSLRIRP